MVTNGDGLFALPNLIPGKYLITVLSPGFSTAVVSDVGLVAGERREVNITMKLGQTSDKVTVVSSEISDVQLASSEVRGVVDSHTVNELPLNGRDWTSLTLLEPRRRAGRRKSPASYRLDGVSINDYSSLGHECVSRIGLRVLAQQQGRCPQLLRHAQRFFR